MAKRNVSDIERRNRERRRAIKAYQDARIEFASVRVRNRCKSIVVEVLIGKRWVEIIDTLEHTDKKFCFEITTSAIRQRARINRRERGEAGT